MKKCWEFWLFQSYCIKPVDELKDPTGDCSGDEMYNSHTKNIDENGVLGDNTLHSCFKDSGCFLSNFCDC